MKRKIKVKAIVIATVYIDEDIQGNQTIEDYDDIEDTLEFEEVK